MKTKFESHFRLIFAEVNDFTDAFGQGIDNMVKSKKSNKASKIYTKMVWTPLRKEGMAQYASRVMEYVPKAPVVESMAKKNKVGKIEVSFGAFKVHYPSWKDLRDGYENLILTVASWMQSFDERKQ